MTAPGSVNTGRIYVYSAPGYNSAWTRTVGDTTSTGQGRFKVGWTGRADARIRIREQIGTAYPDGAGVVVHLDEPAVRDNGTPFTDTDVHHVLDVAGVHRTSEVIAATLDEIRAAITAVRTGRPFDPTRTHAFGLRPEQAHAVDVTATYFTAHADDTHPPRFLWNAKMRFGKTFTTYQLARRMGWTRVLVLTYKPAVLDSWRTDLNTHVDFTGWRFVDRDHPADPDANPVDEPMVWFASFQDLLGKTADGKVKTHNEAVHRIRWDAIVVDEYHFGAWQGAAREVCAPASAPTSAARSAAKVAAEANEAAEAAEAVADAADAGSPRLVAATPETPTARDWTSADLALQARSFLYLSGTPFRALTDGEFNEDAIFNWTYPDEQRMKTTFDGDPADNPYADLPAMHMYTYALSGMAARAAEADPHAAFDLSGYFEAVTENGTPRFTDPRRVAEFLDLLRGKLTQTATEKLLNHAGTPPFPYADPRFADAVRHTVWFLPSVASAHAMRDALASHPFFRDHVVHVAAGTGAGMGAEAVGPVTEMLDSATQLGKPTITLSVGKLMTGVTIPQWGAILVLRSLKSPESYFQAAFRVQSPWSRREPDGTKTVLKDTSYVFDFDPNRALSLIYSYGTRLAGAAITGSPAEEIEQLLSFLPIFAFDGGRMDPVDVNTVMDWATAGAGATMLAKRWGSPRLINLSEHVLTRLLEAGGLLDRLQQMEDFRALRTEAAKIIASSQKIRAAKIVGGSGGESETAPELVAARKEKAKQIETLRKKLLKLAQRIPVFMYLTDFREESLVHVIKSLDTALFERVTGLTIADFNQLSDLGVFASDQTNEAIWQFRLFERASLGYLGATPSPASRSPEVGLWDTAVTEAELLAGPPTSRDTGSLVDKAPSLTAPVSPGGAPSVADLIATGWLDIGALLVGGEGPGGPQATAEVGPGGILTVAGAAHATPDEAARAVTGDLTVDGHRFWQLPGYGSLRELMDDGL